MMAGSIQKTLEGESVWMCVWARPGFILLKSICGKKRWEEDSQRIPPFHSTVPGGTSWAGTNWCEINFPVGYNDPERSHTSLDQWHRKGPVSAPCADTDYLFLDSLAATLARWDRNSMLLKMLLGCDICLWESGMSRKYCVVHLQRLDSGYINIKLELNRKEKVCLEPAAYSWTFQHNETNEICFHRVIWSCLGINGINAYGL